MNFVSLGIRDKGTVSTGGCRVKVEIVLLEGVFESLFLQEAKDVWFSCQIAIF